MIREVVTARLTNALSVLSEKYPIDKIYMHGSMARGEATPLSDVDIAVWLAPEVAVTDPYEQLMLELDMEAALEYACKPYDVDVRIVNHAPQAARDTIVLQGRLLLSRTEDAVVLN